MKRWTWTTPTLTLAVSACLLCFTFALADHKPGHNPGGKDGAAPGGTVYFIHEGAVWTMSPDGSNATPLLPRGDTFSDPSHLRHDEQRWFLNRIVPNGVPPFPNGRSFIEIWAESEVGMLVPLVTEADIEILSPAVWTPGDLSVSFIGERWLLDEAGQPIMAIESGLYRFDVIYDGAGAVAGAGSLEFLADLSTELRVDAAGFTSQGEVAGHSWSPDQPAFTFGVRFWESSPFQQEIWIVDLAQVSDPYAVPLEALVLLDSGNGIGWPEWSPDGSRIGYVSWGGTVIYNLDKDRSKTLRDTPNDGWGLTEWSPDGSHFVLYHWDNFSGYDAIYRFTANLTGKTELTAGLCPPDAQFDCVLIPLGWRD